MPTEKKIQQVEYIEEKLGKCAIAVATEFRGVTVQDMAALRAKLRESQVEYLVVKNNLAGIAADRAGRPGLRDVLQGPTAIAFGYGEIVDPPRVLNDHIKAAQITVTLTGAVTETEVFTAAQVLELATLPPKPILMSMLLSGLQSPLRGLAYALTYHLSGLARVLDAMREKMEVAAAPEAEAPTQEAKAEAEAEPEATTSVEEPRAEAAAEEPKAEAEASRPEEAPTEETEEAKES